MDSSPGLSLRLPHTLSAFRRPDSHRDSSAWLRYLWASSTELSSSPDIPAKYIHDCGSAAVSVFILHAPPPRSVWTGIDVGVWASIGQ